MLSQSPATPRLDEALASGRYLPAAIDPRRRMVWFAEMAPEGYRQAAFLTPRMAPMGEARYGFNLDDVLLRDRSVPVGGAPAHFIFISAFCCSTLLARLLDSTGALVLREPTVLGQVSMLRYPPGADCGWEEEWRAWAELGIRMLGRSFSPGQTVVAAKAWPEIRRAVRIIWP